MNPCVTYEASFGRGVLEVEGVDSGFALFSGNSGQTWETGRSWGSSGARRARVLELAFLKSGEGLKIINK
jgi:hypothetical protein